MKEIVDVKKLNYSISKSNLSNRNTISKSKSRSYQKFFLKKNFNSQRKFKHEIDRVCNYTTIVKKKNIINSTTFHNIWKNFKSNKSKKDKRTKKKFKENNSISKNHDTFQKILSKIKKTSKKKPIFTKNKSVKTIQNFQNPPKIKKQRKTKVKKLNLKKFSTKDFEVLKHLGKGKFGDVFLVKEIKKGYQVALKVINKNLIQRYKAERQIVREIAIHQKLSHPNITKLYGYFHDDKNIYLILEYANQEIMFFKKPNKKFNELQVSKILKQIIQGLIYLQSQNIMHRDLKPENILINKGVYQIADFGWSSQCNQKRETFCGTIDYLAPEVVTSETQDLKIDNWAVGILTFELLVGKTPFQNRSHFEVMQDIKQCNIKYPDFLSLQAKDFIKNLLIKKSCQRINLIKVLQHPFIINQSNQIQNGQKFYNFQIQFIRKKLNQFENYSKYYFYF